MSPVQPRRVRTCAAGAQQCDGAPRAAPVVTIDSQLQLTLGAQRWIPKPVDAGAHGFVFGVGAKAGQPLRLQAIWVAGGCSAAAHAIQADVFVCRGEWARNIRDTDAWRRVGGARLRRRSELVRIRFSPPVLLLGDECCGICVHSGRSTRAVGFSLQPRAQESCKRVTGADTRIELLTGAALHSADAHGPDVVVVPDGYGFSGRVEYASLRSDERQDIGADRPDTLEERQKQAAADTADVHLQLRRKQFVQPPVEFPHRAQLRTAQ